MSSSTSVPALGATPRAGRRAPLGLIVSTSMLTGLVLAVFLSAVLFAGASEPVVTGVVLIGFAVGWAMLARLTARSSQPQTWAYVPATIMGGLGLAGAALGPGDRVLNALGWVWPVVMAGLAVWIVRQARRWLHDWSRAVVLYPVVAVLALTGVGGAYEALASTSSVPMTGELVDVGGYRLHISCTGTGGPTVVLEAGLGEPGAMMAGWIQPAVATATRVCVYDRAGRGFSDAAPARQDGAGTASALHDLLARAHVPGPYVLVGHSSGGVYVRVFAQRYPDDVAGVVLLDSQPGQALTRLPDYPTFYGMFRRATGLMPMLSRAGVMRLSYRGMAAGLPPVAGSEERWSWSRPSAASSLRDEFAELPTALVQSQALTSLGDKPLIVVSAGNGAQTGWMPLQDELLALSTDSEHRVVPEATHASLTEDETFAVPVSARAVLDVVAAVRSGAPLTART